MLEQLFDCGAKRVSQLAALAEAKAGLDAQRIRHVVASRHALHVLEAFADENVPTPRESHADGGELVNEGGRSPSRAQWSEEAGEWQLDLTSTST